MKILDVEVGPAHLLLLAIAVIVGFPLIYQFIATMSYTMNQTASILNNSMPSVKLDQQSSRLASIADTMLDAAKKLLSVLQSKEAVAAMIAAGIILAAIVLRTQ